MVTKETTEIERDVIYEINNGADTLSELCNCLKNRSRSNISRTIDNLQEEGVVRVYQDSEDLRRKKLSLDENKIVMKRTWKDYNFDIVLYISIFSISILIANVILEKVFFLLGATFVILLLFARNLIDILRSRKNTIVLKDF